MVSLKISLLGSPDIELNEKPINLVTRKNLALLAYLAVTKEKHNREELITLLWPDLDPKRARANLRRNLSVMRKILAGEVLKVDGEIVSLDPGCTFYLDIDHFHKLLVACQEHAHGKSESCNECIDKLRSAAKLYRGHFLEGFSLRDSPNFDEWQFYQTESLRQELASALEELVSCFSAQELYDAAIPYARRWLALDSLNELTHRELMKLYAKSGKRTLALRQYQECDRLLGEELNVQPEDETTQLFLIIKENKYPSQVKRTTSLSSKTRKDHIPTQPTPFVGRKVELDKLAKLLNDPDVRLVTILGAGGMGKTHLALEVSNENLDSFPDGVYFISLAPLESINSIIPTVAKSLDFSFYESSHPAQQLLDYLSQKNILLIMDNFEHILEGANWASKVLQSTTNVKILTTSRESLNLKGEYLFPILGMNYPELITGFESGENDFAINNLEQFSALQLFTQSAQRVKPGFDLRSDNFEGVVKICRLVQGMPLAILLASAWVDILEPVEIAIEIEKGLDILESDLRDIPERQRSIDAVFENTWQRLTEDEQEIFMGLSIFQGGFTRQAFVEVMGGSLNELRSLVDKSLLICTQSGRYEIHELLRQFAGLKLSATPQKKQYMHERHAIYYTTYLTKWEANLNGPRPLQALAEIEIEIENARVAWIHLVNNRDINRIGQAIEGLCTFYIWKRRYQEGISICDLALETLEESTTNSRTHLMANILLWKANFCLRLGQIDQAKENLEKTSTILKLMIKAGADTRPENATIQLQKGNIAFDYNLDEALFHYEKSVTLFREVRDSQGTADALMALGWVNWHRGVYDGANNLFEESLRLRRSMGDQRRVVESHAGLGFMAMFQGQFEKAERLIQESLVLLRDLGIQTDLIYDLECRESFHQGIDRESEIVSNYRKSVGLYSDLGFRYSLAPVHSVYGFIKKHLGQYEEARILAKMGCALAVKIGWRQEEGYCLELLGDIAIVNCEYMEAKEYLKASLAIFHETQQLDLSDALASLGYVAIGLGQLSQAQTYLAESLRRAMEIQVHYPITHALPAIALLLAARGENGRAVESYALASRYQRVANSLWFEDAVGKKIATIKAELPTEIVATAMERGRTRDLQATVRELIIELDLG